MSFHGSPRHFQLAGDFCVVTSLQEQFDDLLFTRTQAYGLLFHQTLLPFFAVVVMHRPAGLFKRDSIQNATLPLCKLKMHIFKAVADDAGRYKGEKNAQKCTLPRLFIGITRRRCIKAGELHSACKRRLVSRLHCSLRWLAQTSPDLAPRWEKSEVFTL